jgi:small subunit ribosomal protein S1
VHISELAHHHVENPREILEPGQDVRVKILEIDSERRRLSLSVKRVAEQLEHIKTAAAAGAAAAGVSEELGDVPDLGLSEDVFAGPQVSGVDDLRAAVADFVPPEEAEEAPPLPEQPAEPAEPEASAEAEPEAPEVEAAEPEAPEVEAAEPEADAEAEPEASAEPEAEEAPAEDAPADSDEPEE